MEGSVQILLMSHPLKPVSKAYKQYDASIRAPLSVTTDMTTPLSLLVPCKCRADANCLYGANGYWNVFNFSVVTQQTIG